MDWKEINEAIRSKISEATDGKTGEDAETARAEALKSLDKSFTQPFFDDGFKSADGKRKGELEAAEAAKKAAEAKLETTESRLTELEKKNPNVEAIKAQYDQELADLKTKHENELNQVRTTATQTKVDAFLTRVEASMRSKLTGDRAELAVYRLRDRVKPTDGGGIEVLQPGKDIPFHARTEDELISTIVDTAYNEAPESSRLSKADSGAGSQSGATGTSKKWDQYRNRGKETAGVVTTGLSDESKSKRLSGL